MKIQNLSKLGPIIESILRAARVPGAALAIVAGDKTIYAQGFGYRNLKSRKPVTADTAYPIASTTKAIHPRALRSAPAVEHAAGRHASLIPSLLTRSASSSTWFVDHLRAWLGAGVVSRLPRRAIQIGMGVALLAAAVLFVLGNVGLIPAGGAALELHGTVLIVAIAINVLLGALMTLGVGLYAPCLILLSLLGMSPIAAFPIMMGSCALLMPVAGLRFIASRRYDRSAALGLALGGIPGVLIAAFIVKQLPLIWLRWLVVAVVLYAALTMLRAAYVSPPTESRSQ